MGWRTGLTQQQVEEPASLQFSDGHDGSDGLHETDDGQCGVWEAGREDVLVQPHSVVPHLQGTAQSQHVSQWREGGGAGTRTCTAPLVRRTA